MKRVFVIGGVSFLFVISMVFLLVIQPSSATNSAQAQQSLSYECLSDEDCDDYNSCTLDLCSATPGTCLHTRLSGCHSRYGCIGVGSIGLLNQSPMYCSEQGDWLDMRVTGSYCSHDHQCRSDDCSNGRCVGEEKSFKPMGFWKRLSLHFS